MERSLCTVEVDEIVQLVAHDGSCVAIRCGRCRFVIIAPSELKQAGSPMFRIGVELNASKKGAFPISLGYHGNDQSCLVLLAISMYKL